MKMNHGLDVGRFLGLALLAVPITARRMTTITGVTGTGPRLQWLPERVFAPRANRNHNGSSRWPQTTRGGIGTMAEREPGGRLSPSVRAQLRNGRRALRRSLQFSSDDNNQQGYYPQAYNAAPGYYPQAYNGAPQ